MEKNQIIEDFVVFVEKISEKHKMHPIKVEFIIKEFLEHCPTGSH